MMVRCLITGMTRGRLVRQETLVGPSPLPDVSDGTGHHTGLRDGPGGSCQMTLRRLVETAQVEVSRKIK